MLRFLILRFVLPLFLFLLVRHVFKSVWTSLNAPTTPHGRDPPGGELKRDPVCGTYVAANTALTRTVGGKTIHFCSPACRDNYRPS